MKKNGIEVFEGAQRFQKRRFILKYGLLLLFMSVMFLPLSAVTQIVKLTMNLKSVTIEQVITDVSQKTNYRFLYHVEEVLKYGKRDIQVKEASLDDLLRELLKDTDLSYTIQNDVVIITPADGKDEKVIEKPRLIKGKVVDEAGESLPGVTVLIKGTKLGVVTDVEGKFKIEVPVSDSTVLVFSFVGMKPLEYRLKKDRKDDAKELLIKLADDVKQVDEVVVTGYANIRKESFTGSSISVKREELLKASSTNVIQALSTFDPSFRIQQSNKWGSDPNAIPEIYIRGRSGIGVKELDKDAFSKSSLKNNPNLPVFIMDGFEVSVQKVYDMDPMRVKDIQILKDASATAMYGSRAANGVVVITTMAPKPGEVTVSYSLTGTYTMPDLSDYNLASAAEKLEIEKRAGIYVAEKHDDWADAMNEYNKRLAEIQRGVDTDWLSIPLRNAFNHKHTLSIEGGNEDLRYGIDATYDVDNGVMKDSYRNNMNFGFHIDYRIKRLQVVNYIEYGYTDSQDSPYGDFADYSHLQPYDSPYNKDGSLVFGNLKFSQDRRERGLNNPLYEALLNNYQFDKSDVFTDRLMAQWYLTDAFFLKGQFAVTKEITKGERFIDPLSAKVTASFNGEDKKLRGDLYINKGDATKWDAQFGAYLSKVFGGHALNASMVINGTSSKSEGTSSHYRGFPSGKYHSPNYAAEIYLKPNKSQNLSRLVGVLFLANYTWNDIYLADVSVRFDGSSEFGSNQKWAPFWSGGLGINIHNYKFLKESNVVSRLKIRGSYGQTGKVNFPSYSAKTVYKTFDRWYDSGFGVALKALGNKDLKWETTNKLNLGTDLGFWNDRISLNFDYYNNKTIDLITDVDLQGSSGFTSYKSNMGENVNKGFDIQMRLEVLRDKDWNVALWGNLNHNRNEILKISDALKAYNARVDEYYKEAEQYQHSGSAFMVEAMYAEPMMKYEEGASLTSIYAVRSLGIDPTNGKEMFLYKNGTVSQEWKASQQVKVGDTEPKASGSFGFNAVYKNLSLFASFSYDWGKQVYNQTLVDNVENADIQYSNVDRRVLTQRWEKPGDIAPLKDIKDMKRVTLPTSRFVQDENVLSLTALTLSYDFNSTWLKKVYLKTLRVEMQTSEIFRLSSVKLERGTSYPFARSVNFSLRATF